MESIPPRVGWGTSEFWITVLVVALTNAVAFGLVPEDSVWSKVVLVALAVLAAVGYTASRTAVKRAHSAMLADLARRNR